jgi:hypothetical protein
LHSNFTFGFIRTRRRSTPLSFETEEGSGCRRSMDAKKGKTRKESTPIKVWVTPEEKAAIAAKADAHSLSASSYLRRLGLALSVESTIDQRAILDLVKINADLGRFGGLIKMWLTSDSGFASVSGQGLQRKLENTLTDVRLLQKKMSDRLDDL